MALTEYLNKQMKFHGNESLLMLHGCLVLEYNYLIKNKKKKEFVGDVIIGIFDEYKKRKINLYAAQIGVQNAISRLGRPYKNEKGELTNTTDKEMLEKAHEISALFLGKANWKELSGFYSNKN